MELPPSIPNTNHNTITCVKGLATAGDDVLQGHEHTGHQEKEILGLLRAPSSAGK